LEGKGRLKGGGRKREARRGGKRGEKRAQDSAGGKKARKGFTREGEGLPRAEGSRTSSVFKKKRDHGRLGLLPGEEGGEKGRERLKTVGEGKKKRSKDASRKNEGGKRGTAERKLTLRRP